MTTDSVPTAWTKDSEPPLVAVTSTHANNVKKHSQIIQRLNAAVNIQTGMFCIRPLPARTTLDQTTLDRTTLVRTTVKLNILVFHMMMISQNVAD